jgi:hypothetical protein
MAEAEVNLEATHADFQAAEDENQRRQFALLIDYHQCVVDLKPILEIRAPNITFTERMEFANPILRSIGPLIGRMSGATVVKMLAELRRLAES